MESDLQISLNTNEVQLSYDQLQEIESTGSGKNQFDPAQTISHPYESQGEQFQTNLDMFQDHGDVQSFYNQLEDQTLTSSSQDQDLPQTGLSYEQEPVQTSLSHKQEPVQTSFHRFEDSDISALLLDIRQNSLSNLHLPFSSTYSGKSDHAKRSTTPQRKNSRTSESSCSTSGLKFSPKESFKKAVKEQQLARAGLTFDNTYLNIFTLIREAISYD